MLRSTEVLDVHGTIPRNDAGTSVARRRWKVQSVLHRESDTGLYAWKPAD